MKTPSMALGPPSKNRTVGRVLNLLLWLAFCALVGTGLLLAFRLSPGSRGGAGLVALDMTRHEWGAWHTWIGYAFLVMIAIHLALHWKWLWRVAAGSKSWPLLFGLGAGIVLLAWLALQPITKRQAGGGARINHSLPNQQQ
jgi:Domain of unknown function (DUF4405)